MERLSFAAELDRVHSRILDKHQKGWEISQPEKVTITYIINSRSAHVIKAIVNTTDDIDLNQPART